MTTRRKAAAILGLLLLANLLAWAVALTAFHHFALLIGTATLAYTFGLRHALDADHISAIDNVTRKLMHDGRRPLLVGFFFSLGHSTIVVLLSIAIAATASRIQNQFPNLQRIGSLIGAAVSAGFLLLIAGLNLLVLRGVLRSFRRVKLGESCEDHDTDEMLAQLGLMGRIFRPVLRVVDQSWKMYFVGFLFGLGFDTATEIGLIGISAAAATQGLPIWSILIFPLLFTAGMCLLDTADGILMVGVYGWAFVHPVRKLYYNLTITFISVLIALLVGGIEILGVVRDQFDLRGSFWNVIAAPSDHFGAIGVFIVVLFVTSWAVSVLAYRLAGLHQLEAAMAAAPENSGSRPG